MKAIAKATVRRTHLKWQICNLPFVVGSWAFVSNQVLWQRWHLRWHQPAGGHRGCRRPDRWRAASIWLSPNNGLPSLCTARNRTERTNRRKMIRNENWLWAISFGQIYGQNGCDAIDMLGMFVKMRCAFGWNVAAVRECIRDGFFVGRRRFFSLNKSRSPINQARSVERAKVLFLDCVRAEINIVINPSSVVD